MTYPLRSSLAVVLLVVIASALVGCGSGQGASEQGSATQGSTEQSTSEPPPAPEPADAPPTEEQPAGNVVQVGNMPEGIAADPETGLVAVGLRDPNQLALVDGSSGDVVKTVDLPAAPRHLDLFGRGGPVLVPAEKDNTLLQISLPGGDIKSQTTVGAIPHNVAAAPNNRIFVINEFGDNASVIEGDRVVDTIDTPLQPGGVAVTDNGLVGVVGVRGLALEVYDADSLKSQGRADAGAGPTHVKAGPGNHFYVADTRGDAVLVYGADPEPKQLDSASLSGTPYGMAIDPGRKQLWVTLTAKNQVVRFSLDGDTIHEIDRYPTVRQPNSVAVNPDTGRVYVTGTANGELQIIEPN